MKKVKVSRYKTSAAYRKAWIYLNLEKRQKLHWLNLGTTDNTDYEGYKALKKDQYFFFGCLVLYEENLGGWGIPAE